MLQEIVAFLKHPVYEEDKNTDRSYRLAFFLKLLGISVLFSIILGILINLIQKGLSLELGTHAIEQAFEEFSPLFILLLAVVIAPLLEESMFRAPMWLFRKMKQFSYVFYVLTLIFGFYHIFNYELSTTVLLLAPILVFPQICIGAFLGFIRVRFGFWWAVLLHACYNFLLIGPIVFLKLLDIPIG